MLGRLLKPIFPRGLYWRAALIVFVPVTTILLVVSLAFIQRHYDGVTRQMTGNFVLVAHHLLAEADAAPDAAAAERRVERLARAFELEAAIVPEAPPSARAEDLPFYDLSGRLAVRELARGLPEMDSVALYDGGVTLWLAGRHGHLELAFQLSRISARNPHQMLVLTLVIGVVMGMISFIYLKNQMRPMLRLAHVAEAFGHGQTLPYRVAGATEVRAAGKAFLEMRARIERHIEQRTLMLSGVSHDLRTPLTRMKLALSLMPEDDDTEALMRDVAQMERMVDEFLAFARGDAMEDAVPVDPVALVQEIADEAARAGQPLRLGRLDWPGGTIRLRPHAVRRALDNLIGNAVRHGTVAELSLAAGERMLRFSVEDDGPGIPRELREEAMQPFRRLDAARDPNKGGVGLGLAIAADVARSHGGVLRLLDSETLGGLRAELSVAR